MIWGCTPYRPPPADYPELPDVSLHDVIHDTLVIKDTKGGDSLFDSFWDIKEKYDAEIDTFREDADGFVDAETSDTSDTFDAFDGEEMCEDLCFDISDSNDGDAEVCEFVGEIDDTCDDIDDDCDGETDEEFPIELTECGVGGCLSTGILACVGGDIVDTCVEKPAEIDDSFCDGIDGDCDGWTDEDFESETTSCGIGACFSEGLTLCIGGEVQDSCEPALPAPDDPGCDGIDDDCDDLVDEDFIPYPTSCGAGACAADGEATCEGGFIIDSCEPLATAPDDSECNGIDDDCDGETDEDFVSMVTACGIGGCASVGLTLCVGGSVQDSCKPGKPAPDDATCDAIDDDCDTKIDEDVHPIETECGTGACLGLGLATCLDGIMVDSCEEGVPALDDSECNGIDDDCDGETDEEFVSSATECGLGGCVSTGSTSCINGEVQNSCTPEMPTPDDAKCDGVDSDCDEEVDEDFMPYGIQCGVGGCIADGLAICLNGEISNECTPGAALEDDTSCDGIDGDCDSETDEDFVSMATMCGTGGCLAEGITLCIGGGIQDNCVPGEAAPNDASCNGVDDDCDGKTDEDYVQQITKCGVGGCFEEGATTCLGGVILDSCVAGTPALDDSECNGIDDDCDGETDEDFTSQATECGTGACLSSGETSCINGVVQNSCTPLSPAFDDATCDGIDDDCDNDLDEDFTPYSIQCGIGGCVADGLAICLNGEISNECTPGAALEDDTSCDGIDGDCDSETDEDFISMATICGTGGCLAEGVTLCIGGGVQDNCVPGEAAPNDASCNGVDDDCSGETDEDFISETTECGTGACWAQGLTICLNGMMIDNCEELLPAIDDSECNGVDDDCNGETDEDFVSQATECGTGACVDSGETSCVNGEVQNNCVPLQPALDDATCNGVDDDCNGESDEDFIPYGIQCGVGICQANGLAICLNGEVVNECTPGLPAPDDTSCDATDNDCDGFSDEDYIPETSSCGVGACISEGTIYCIGGAFVDNCEPGQPSVELCDNIDNNCNNVIDDDCIEGDFTCDGVDDDEDGETDEEFEPYPTSCGIGECFAEGLATCVNASIIDSCEPGSPAPLDTICNNLDEDCDSNTDEDVIPVETYCGTGACAAEGLAICVGGEMQDSCTPGQAAATDTSCAGVDNNCNGETDEGFISYATSCGQGACLAEGLATCVNGDVVDDCTPGNPALDDATCNNVDDNCNGFIDEDFVQSITNCGVGACEKSGTTSCIDGDVIDSCVPGQAAQNDTSCNAVDDDCDGEEDEDFISQATECGTGACSSTGQTTCVAGEIVNDCVPGDPAANDATCNGVDDDCNNETDEDYQNAVIQCGVGACLADGLKLCVNGELTDECTPGQPAPTDSTCDNVDNNCNGETDEGFVSYATSCGQGACLAEGLATCVGGQVVDSCTPGNPALDDATCDNIDDNCNGFEDEDFASTVTNCGVGACEASGTTSCVDGDVIDSCVPGQAAQNDTSCNGVDDDCNGETDDGFVAQVTECGVGACAAEGATACVDGEITNNCTPGDPAGSDANCDGVDNNCNNEVDEDYQNAVIQCGVGACLADGLKLCVNGELTDECTPGQPAPTDSTCDNVDNNCNGEADEGFVSYVTSCGQGACLAEGLATCLAGNIIDSCLPGEAAANDSTCDNVDDDCDGFKDEDFIQVVTNCGVGPCEKEGITSCVDGEVMDSCLPGTPAPSDVNCDNIDDDCNGEADDGFIPYDIECGTGVCFAEGLALCVQGSIVNDCAEGEPTGNDSDCDNTDNNCNGFVDENFVPFGTGCGVGACAAEGMATCVGGEILNSCTPGEAAPNDTTCDGVDDDCDSAVDEDYQNVIIQCGVGACVEDGLKLCVGGEFVENCVPGDPAENDTTCDGVDDDCNGFNDEDFNPYGTNCGVGACFAAGTMTCVGGQLQNDCEPGAPALTDDECDGIDNNCNGTTDEEYAPEITACGSGACAAEGTTECMEGDIIDNCTPGLGADDDLTCDDVDDDCNGETDDGYIPQNIQCGVGACMVNGLTICVGGSEVDNCTPGDPADNDATCNSVDDDCNGATDDGYIPQNTECGVGACMAEGITSCVGGTEVDDCAPGTPAESDTNCDGVDDDCNGVADDGFVSYPTNCGQGACFAEGLATCVGGAIIDSCEEGTPALNDVTCDNVDDDCDNEIDEDYIGNAIQCGVGACIADGITACVGGTELDDCTPGQPAASDTTCDNVDDDCNGVADDGFVSYSTNCGQGACFAEGLATCINGILSDSCEEGIPAPNDVTCDNDDDDCDNEIDEDYIGNAIQCGVGACLADGITTCVGGAELDDCTPGQPAPSDESCDNVDDDCNNQTDDGFVPYSTECGVGACVAEGEATCVGGEIQNSCIPGMPAINDETCNNIDDDCDGATDEDFASYVTSCGVGACQAEGLATCVGGEVIDSCTPGEAAANDVTCDNVDDDCNGETDEDYVPTGMSCGVGSCVESGLIQCVGGELIEECTPGTPTDEICDGHDNDCDGNTDEICIDNIQTGSLLLVGYTTPAKTEIINKEVFATIITGEAPLPDSFTVAIEHCIEEVCTTTDPVALANGIELCDFSVGLGNEACEENQPAPIKESNILDLTLAQLIPGMNLWSLSQDETFRGNVTTLSYDLGGYNIGLEIPIPNADAASCYYLFNTYACD